MPSAAASPAPLDQPAEMIQQLARVMLDPAGLRIDLAMLESAEAREAAVRVEAIGLAAGGALIDGDDGGHGPHPPAASLWVPSLSRFAAEEFLSSPSPPERGRGSG